MDQQELTERFESYRSHLQAVAYRMLGSSSDADDAVQEAWLRLRRSDTTGIENLGGWLTTVVSRVCLDLLRTRRARRDDPVGALPDAAAGERGSDPEREAVLTESVGRALLVVLDRLSPAERIAFVLHDLFAVPFDQIGPVVGRSPASAKKLASRARLRVQGAPALPPADLVRHRRVVDAFLAAARGRDVDGLVAVLDPGVVRRADLTAVPAGVPTEVRGVEAVIEETLLLSARARAAGVALVDGRIGLVVAPAGRLAAVLRIDIIGERVTGYEVIADPTGLAAVELGALDLPPVPA